MEMDHELVAQHRFESFKLGKPIPASHSMPATSTNKPHRHTRSHSRNASVSLSFSQSASANDISASTKRNSHHRRRSSVSTRTESAEIMGVSVPDLPASLPHSSDNDKDSVRRRALWALEGKHHSATVEIPELKEDALPLTAEFPTKPSFPPGFAMNMNLNKRDSFKPCSSKKDQLGTLVEEEEEEDDEQEESVLLSPVQVSVPAPAPVKTRPNLALRPLSLTPDSIQLQGHGLPTPPTSSASPNLRRLSLTAIATTTAEPTRVRPTLHINPSASSPTYAHVVASSSSSSSISSDDYPLSAKPRRSSISYKTSQSQSGLPTPDMTPSWSERRFSSSSTTSSVSASEEGFFPPRGGRLSASEQHFLFKSHNALLARIQDLERALSVRPLPTPLSTPSPRASLALSDTSEAQGPSDELLSLVADLKAERDDLKRDVDGWRERVHELEKQIGVLAKRVEVERREAWVARARVREIEVEKSVLETEVDALRVVEEDKGRLEDENIKLKAEVEELKRQLASRSAPAPTPSFDGEEEEEEEEDALAGYEDEDDDLDCDMEFATLHSSDSFGSTAEYPACNATPKPAQVPVLPTPPNSVNMFKFPRAASPMTPTALVPAPTQTHRTARSLSMPWTFPRTPSIDTTPSDVEEVDRFFGCLEDSSTASETSLSSAEGEEEYDYERSKALFSLGLGGGDDDDDDEPFPFVLPPGVMEKTQVHQGLGVVEEEEEEEEEDYEEEEEEEEDEEEEEEEMEIDEDMEVGGIRITFTPPEPEPEPGLELELTPEPEPKVQRTEEKAEKVTEINYSASPFVTPPPSSRKAVPMPPPVYEDDQDADVEMDVPFRFKAPMPITPSSIPRSTSFKSAVGSPSSPLSSSTSSLSSSTSSSTSSPSPSRLPIIARSKSPVNAMVTPPNRRPPSFIPQPSPSKIRQPSNGLGLKRNGSTNSSFKYPVLRSQQVQRK